MFYYYTCKRNRKLNCVIKIFQPSYDVKKNFKISKYTVPLFFPSFKIAFEYGEYENDSKRTEELEKAGIKVFNSPDCEDACTAAGRLLYIIKNT